jgi:hypothetical protein
MSLFEWLGESWNPGSIGSLSFGKDDKPRRPRALVIVRFIFAAGLLGGSYAQLIY